MKEVKAGLFEVEDGLFLLDLPQSKEGFRKFISSWIIKDSSNALIIDIGSTSTIHLLQQALISLGIKNVEYILLTHIHIDHAGGIGDFLELYPEAKVILNEAGERHLLNPNKLWESSKKVLGDLADVYGRIKAIPESSIYKGELKFAGQEIQIIYSPGHAVHHQSYIFDDFVFAGEAAGVYQSLEREFYLRPATPPEFDYRISDSSIDKLMAIGNKKLCYGHFGQREDSLEMLRISKEQLKRWVDVVKEQAKRFEHEREIIIGSKEELLKRDPIFSRYILLDEDIRKREDFFVERSLRGILGYIDKTISLAF